MRRPVRYRELNLIRSEYARRRREIANRLAQFAAVPHSEYYYELAYCLMTPQSSAAHAGKVVERLRQEGFQARGFNPAPILARRDHYIRFHNTKARRLLEARDAMEAIDIRLSAGGEPAEMRAWLVDHVKGLGWKEASHFLRNVGYRGLAILDRHILKNLRHHRVISVLPGALTAPRYMAIEEKFRRFAGEIDIPMDELDLLFWSRETGEILK